MGIASKLWPAGARGRCFAAFAGFMCLGILTIGCSRTPMQVDVTQLAPYVHAAKAVNCDMPVYERMPAGQVEQVAIVEAWADLKDQTNDVIPALKRKACETGADALVLINSKHQDVKHLLYGATPNETMNEVTQQNGYSDPGNYIRTVEHTRRIGEAGHNGLYMDAVAIYIDKAGNKVGSDLNSSSSPNS